MKITITTKLRGRKDVSDLTKVFLELYDSSNAMVISNDEAKLEVDLTSCNRKKAKSFFDEMLAMFYGEEVTTQEKEEEPVTTTAKPQEVSNKEKNSREINKQEADNHEEEGKTATTTDIRVVSPEEIKLIEGENYEQVLEKIAQSSSSYGEFLHSVEFDLQLSKLNRDKFWVLMDGAQVFEKPEAIKLSKILKAVESKGKQLNRNEANYLFTQIKARTGYSGSEFVRILLKYREKDIMQLRVGSGLPNIQKKSLENFVVPLPTFEKQCYIECILESITAKKEIETALLGQFQSQKKFLLSKMFI